MNNFLGEIIDVCRLPFSEVINTFKVIQLNDKAIYVSNYTKFLDYTTTKVVLKVKNKTLEINGDNLKISLINKKEIVVKGIINSFGTGFSNEK